ncbi:hypothetical protein KVP40.0024 [Vibrio phage KVP40]|uniref:Uncharacterized protein n=4 Tax=Schizotequatrovirus KVP40 TaxID=1914019 RepID=Q6WIC7_BPKVM|nr:hypothetical protein KVP40.0024 [Vibrio phage KVP40]AFN37258.1 hypothetical protein pp2_024 [Vibrio phage phi-pp2]QHJ74207.1 hypothetical protein VH12019_00288 [Vibrio phage VH1_2019]QIW91011.1 hypothetical protein COHAPHLL_00148 [Vibrio phage V09]UNA01920.1 hypothetical protein [Vibrio phage PC-Liy1]URQ03217.1 hypothetical protein PVA8_231 [Vibrio phage PVA8]WBM58952.1 hypothetical protein vBValMPVA8_230 [Vibrio phage vB_ValM_PVA8]WOL24935.1 hypothetical protein [Vibrio phage PG216]
MMIAVHLLSQAKPVVHEHVKNAYTKDGLYCLMMKDGMVYKYPLINIFRITENM